MSIKVSLKGIEQVQARLNALGPKVQAAAEAAMFETAGVVMAAAQKTVPVKTGRLRSSAYIRKIKRNQHRSDVEFGYSVPYAGPVDDRRHWFSQAVATYAPQAINRIIAMVRAALKR